MKEENIQPLSHANIIEILGIGSLPLEKRMAIVDATIDLVDARVRNRVLEGLSEKARERFLALAEEENEEALEEFFEDHDIDLLTLSEEEVEKAKQELVTFVEQVEEEV